LIKLNNGASFKKNSTMFLEDDFKPIAEARVRIKFGVAFFVLILLLVIIRLGFVSLSGKKQASQNHLYELNEVLIQRNGKLYFRLVYPE